MLKTIKVRKICIKAFRKLLALGYKVVVVS